MNKVLLGLVVFLILLLLGGGAAVYFMAIDDSSEKKEVVQNNDLTEVGVFIPLDTFTVNIMSPGLRSYLKIDITLEFYESETIVAEAEEKKSLIRDKVIRILSAKSSEELFTEKGKEKLKEDLEEEINPIFTEKLKNIYFTDFIMQI